MGKKVDIFLKRGTAALPAGSAPVIIVNDDLYPYYHKTIKIHFGKNKERVLFYHFPIAMS